MKINKDIGLVFVLIVALLVSCKDESNKNNGSSQQDVGVLSVDTNDGNRGDSILSIQAISSPNQQSVLSSLKICNDIKCWIVVENENIGGGIASLDAPSQNTRKVTMLSDSSNSDNLIDIGSFVVNGVDNNIDRLKYTYNGKSGELKLNEKFNFNKFSDNNLYLKLSEEVSAPFSSLSVKNGKNGIYVPGQDFRKEFINGVILEVEKDSSDQMANLYINKVGSTYNNDIEINSYSIKFYRISPQKINLDNTVNTFPKFFFKKIRVYIPISYSNINTDEIKYMYDLYVNNEKNTYDIIYQNNQSYIFFETVNSKIRTMFKPQGTFGG